MADGSPGARSERGVLLLQSLPCAGTAEGLGHWLVPSKGPGFSLAGRKEVTHWGISGIRDHHNLLVTLDQPPSLLEPDFRGWGSRVWQELVSTTGEPRGPCSGGLEGRVGSHKTRVLEEGQLQ